jgi:hypothetical protein
MTGAAELWTLSRVIAAGEALAPAAREGAASPGASTQVRGPLVAIVTHREPTGAVHCKRSGETVPRTQITLADDTREGARAVLWRTHAGVDVGARDLERPAPRRDSGHPTLLLPLTLNPNVTNRSPGDAQAPETWWRSNPSARDGTSGRHAQRRARGGRPK